MRYLILILVFLLAACQTADPAITPTPEAALVEGTTAESATLTEETGLSATVEAEALPTQETENLSEAEAANTLEPLPTVEGALNLPADIVIPPPGEIVLAAATEEPDAAAQPFEYILYTQDGGPANASIVIEVFGDGRVVRNGESISASAEDIAALDQKVKEIRFFNIQGIFTTAGASEDLYRYTITVESELGSKMIRAQDGYTPQPLLELFSQVVALTEAR